MFHEYQVIGYTETGTLMRLGCGVIFLLPNNLIPGENK
jgi:hypothetical protein